jgi:NarL family two-component system response regulator YdfI
MSDRIAILICDDHAIVRDGLRLILETVADFEVIGEAQDGAEAVRLAEELTPKVVLMDLRMPGMDGLTALQKLQKEQPYISVIILTTYNEDELMFKGLQAGARGYLLKDTGREMLFNTIRAAARGETLLSPEIMERVLNQAGGKSKPSDLEAEVTERELEVLREVGAGKTSKQIALHLGITERTVKAHLTNIYNKLGVDSRAAAIAEAARRGWLGE